jgi:outer membrane protein assembly factor BamB
LALAVTLLSAAALAQSPDTTLVTLHECWKAALNAPIVAQPVADDSQVYVAQDDGRLSAFSAASGTRLWSAEVGGEIVSNLVAAGKNILLVTNTGGNRSVLRSISAATGVPNQEADILNGRDIGLGIAGDRLIAVYSDGTVTAFAAGGSQPAWQLKLAAINTRSVSFQEDAVVVPTSDKHIYVIAADDGKVRQSSTTRGVVTTIGGIEQDLLWGEDRGDLIRFDTEGKSVSWRYKNGAKIISARSAGDDVLAASNDNFVYLLSGYNGDIRWKKRLSGRIQGLAADEKFGVATVIGDPTAVVINLENGKQVGQYLTDHKDGFTYAPLIVSDSVVFFNPNNISAASAERCRAK